MRTAIALAAGLAALALSMPANAQSVKGGKYCLETRNASGKDANCSFQTMASCEKAKSGINDSCTPNSRMTTGSGSGMKKH